MGNLKKTLPVNQISLSLVALVFQIPPEKVF